MWLIYSNATQLKYHSHLDFDGFQSWLPAFLAFHDRFIHEETNLRFKIRKTYVHGILIFKARNKTISFSFSVCLCKAGLKGRDHYCHKNPCRGFMTSAKLTSRIGFHGGEGNCAARHLC